MSFDRVIIDFNLEKKNKLSITIKQYAILLETHAK